MGVFTGPSLQSVRFSVRHIPYGHYDLCVIANGISSHCVTFYHRKLIHRSILSVPTALERVKSEETLYYVKEDVVADPEIVELKAQIKWVQNSIRRLESIIKTEEPKREPKEITKEVTGKAKGKS
jgi:hypothetical protein